ncbi:MAG: alpha/beta hydrolase fold [Myxococcaceae bacterium]|nr:alpha/beta hydrolase fold [Myxococcaceae bacterium]
MPKFAITRDGVRVAYEAFGQGAPLILVHGLGDERSIWEEVVQRLEPHYTCITLDLRGHGQTTGASRFDPFELMHDLEAVINDSGTRRPALVGHSLGAFVATMYAALSSRPVRSIVNVDQALELEALSAAVRPHEASLRAGRVKEVFFEVLGVDGAGPLRPEQRARLERTRESLAPEVVLGLCGPFFEISLAPFLERVERALERVQVPYLCLFGHDASPSYLAWLRGHIPVAEVESWSGLGHFMHLIEPERFCERVRQFVG